MRKHLFLIALLFTGLVACKSKSAFNFSQDIVAKERSLTADINITEDKVEKFATAQQFDSVAVVSEQMEKKVQTKIDEIMAMKVPSAKEADNFREAALRYFKYIKSIYTAYKNVGLAPTAEERSKLAGEMEEVASKKDEVVADMQRAQRKYAEANGFKIEK
ncbi:MAG: hypothetical protein NTW29_21540 [Bacteroidetes bacterium]|nr:hypothetical protein [Bacteroidota bacterium]